MKAFIPLATLCLAGPALAQQAPVIDMHMHVEPVGDDPLVKYCLPLQAVEPPLDHTRPVVDQYFRSWLNPTCEEFLEPVASDEELLTTTLLRMRANNTIAVLQGEADRVREWMEAAPGRFIPSLKFSVGRDNHEDVSWVREAFANGGFIMLGEVGNQYRGVAPNDPRMDAIWAMAAELDVPVGYHSGLGPPGITPTLYPNFSVAAGNPLLFDDVLKRHPNLRISIQHMAMGFHDELKMMMWTYPTLYVELSGPITGSEDFHSYLKDLIDARLENRILFGVDAMFWPDLLDQAIAEIENAEYLSEDQKRKILFENAVRFLNLNRNDALERAVNN
ncbi:metal-dependent hydrolase [Blastomonas marina]|uniref:Metal-dependent hydrolase n=1 Tax=Blastomonas marina TaxID=1867408 RepID=A0ABQ1F617_9SPHN|nr:amidohydrolase family protein [Blastomonas marina]GGA00492.1 metal-dependent hydrolase [Blastomonas marina]